MKNLRPAPGVRISQNVFGRTATLDRRGPWRHPWFTEPLWSPVRKRWECTVRPGFVNGRAPVVATTAGAMRGGAFFGQIIDPYSGAAEIEQAARLASTPYDDLPDGAQIDVPLYKRPPIGLHSWKRVASIPQYFRDRGATPPPAQGVNTTTGQVTLATPAKGARVLVSCDVMVRQPRTALTGTIEINVPGAVTGATIVNQTLGMRPAAAGDKLRIQSGDFSEQRNLQYQPATQLVDDYEEATWDLLHISTVFLLSPPDTAEEAAPDETWEPHVQHAQFWNMSWYQPLLRDAVFASDIFAPLLGTLSVLGGGSGFAWASTVTASINDAVQGAYNLLTAASLAGTFWTPTGSGSTSAWPEEKPDPPQEGLNKAANAAAKAEATWAEKAARRLDPPFPYEGAKFNRSLLA